MAEHPPLISVLLPAYNCAGTLAEAVDSILVQTLADFELIVVNDGSTDGTGQVLDALAARDARVRPVHTANGGIVNALNAALALARGEFVARMDGDDRSHPTRFAQQVAHLRARPSCVCVGTLFRLIDAEGRVTTVQNPIPHFRQTDLKVFPPHVASLPHPSIMLRRADLQRIGGYRHGFRHAEDYDLFLRLAEAGSLEVVQEPLLDYRVHAGSLSSANLEGQVDSALRALLFALLRSAGRPEPQPSVFAIDRSSLERLFGDTRFAKLVELYREFQVACALHMRIGRRIATHRLGNLLVRWCQFMPTMALDPRFWRIGVLSMRQAVKIAIGRI